MTQRTKYLPMRGGLDVVTPPIARAGGVAINGYNYEPRLDGYRRILGFERDDGTGLPSAEDYIVQYFGAGSVQIDAGDTVTGATSGATGQAMFEGVVTSGAYATNDAAGFVVLGVASAASFQDGENLQVSAATRAVASGAPVVGGAANDTDHKTWQQAAVELKRSLIGAVPGSGAIRGVWQYNGVTYAFRDNVGGSACIMHKATPSGWQTVALGDQVSFTTGTDEIFEGDTLTGLTSGATATVERVIVATGGWSTNDAAGRLILSGISGAFLDAESLQVSAATKATASGSSAPITLQPGGRYEFVNYNFYGASALKRMYGCDGVNNGFEFDGSVYVPIETGMIVDAPTHITAHRNYLIFAYRGGSVQFSALGDPISWLVMLGAGEIGLGDDVTGFIKGYAGVLVVFGRNKTAILYGKVFAGQYADADLDIVNDSVGAIEWTCQLVSEPVFFDNAGVRDLKSVQAYGNFKASIKSQLAKTWIDAKMKTGVTVTASLVVRDQSQYWLFFSDGTGLIGSFDGGSPEFMPLRFDRVVRCAASIEDADGNEVIFFGSDDGYVYRFNSGDSMDGVALPYLIRLAFNNLGTPTLKKRFHKATLEMATEAQANMRVTADFSYGSPDLPSVLEESFEVYGGGGFWDAVYWDNFYWSQAEGTAEARIPGAGVNISIAIGGETTFERPHTIHGITYHYSARGLKR